MLTALVRVALVILSTTVAGAAARAVQGAGSLSPKEQLQLVERGLALDVRSTEGRTELETICGRLDELPALTAADVKTWRAKMTQIVIQRSRKIETKTGSHYFWPARKKGDVERGLYIVGGESKRPKALLIGLHGGGAGEGDAWSAHGAMNAAAKDMDWLAIFPEVLEKTEHGWTDSGTEEFVMDLVEAALCTWKIDRDRVYFGGHSMGGYGTWTLGARHADQMAGLMASAGAPTPVLDRSGQVIDIDYGIIPNLRNVALRIYQSDDDPRVPPDVNRIAAKKLAEAKQLWGGFDFDYWEVPGRQHELAPGGFEVLYRKVADKTRNARPDQVVWQPVLKWVRQSYWLWWDEPRMNAIVHAKVDRAANEVHVECSKASKGLSVLLDDTLLDLNKDVGVFLDQKEVFRGRPQRTLSTLLRTALRNDATLSYCARIPLSP